ncbi:MAG TPA: ATPase [Anaerolinea thermolimosa]|uniref:ATPase n=2 Tax=Anaerolinea thermolimosa TaxID=229919 RepID=A0A3D1JFB9_9CHLR|nr:predicted N-acetylglucosamine kinase [Anaerolinea thermolimosa]HCE17291.1 ATPase [Anaerolinea thermolimosa]
MTCFIPTDPIFLNSLRKMTMKYYLGIDVGGTKTHALIADEHGTVRGFGAAGPGNHEGVGYDGLATAMQASLQAALAQAHISLSEIAGAGFGIAGYDFPSERQPTLDAIATLGLDCPVEAVNDVVIGLIAGASHGWGVVVDAGTGCNVRGRTADGREGWVTGCGSLFGEYGGAGDIVFRAVQAISHHWSRRGPATALSEAFIRKVGASSLTDLIEGLALQKYHIHGEYARLVFEVASSGDAVAQEVIRWIATELGETTNAVIRQIDIQNQTFEVVLIGSVFNGGPLFTRPLQETILSFAPGATFTRLTTPPVVGGVLLGMEVAGLCTDERRSHLIESTHAYQVLWK